MPVLASSRESYSERRAKTASLTCQKSGSKVSKAPANQGRLPYYEAAEHGLVQPPNLRYNTCPVLHSCCASLFDLAQLECGASSLQLADKSCLTIMAEVVPSKPTTQSASLCSPWSLRIPFISLSQQTPHLELRTSKCYLWV